VNKCIHYPKQTNSFETNWKVNEEKYEKKTQTLVSLSGKENKLKSYIFIWKASETIIFNFCNHYLESLDWFLGRAIQRLEQKCDDISGVVKCESFFCAMQKRRCQSGQQILTKNRNNL